MRFTLDSNILVRAAVSPQGPAYRLLDLILNHHTLVVSQHIVDEVRRVLLYPHLQTRYRVSSTEADEFLRKLSSLAYIVEPVLQDPIGAADPDDDAVLYAAAEAKSSVLCTLNLRHFNSAPARTFCARHGIRVMTDVEALRELLLPTSGT